MNHNFEEIIKDENICELFTKKNVLNEEEAKYFFNNHFTQITFIILSTVNLIIYKIRWHVNR